MNLEAGLGWPPEWQGKGTSHLWGYNLHYFDYLHQPEMSRAEGLSLMRSWIQRHSVRAGAVGWEPYPLSLRIVNWVKFLSRETDPTADLLESLQLQALNLERQVEYHLLGNHLWANGKALWFAGDYLGEDSVAARGRKIIREQLDEQFLRDGGHFELSPMYHAILLEDLLDLVNLCGARGASADREMEPRLRETAGRALGWLRAIVDGEGRIPLLNDAVHGVAVSWSELRDYGARLGIDPDSSQVPERDLGGWSARNLSGYWAVERGPFRVIFDAAPLGPDYLPGHAHCDMLSILMHFDGAMIFADTGVFEYEEGERRLRARGAAGHNTVVLDGLDQAELWKSFRVGRRGKPVDFGAAPAGLQCSHTGFAIWKKGLDHTRRLAFWEDGFEVRDAVKGPGRHDFQAFFHFAPKVGLRRQGGGFLINERLQLEPWGAQVSLTTSQYYPEFGRVEERPCLVLSGRFSRQTSFGIRCTSSS